ncbi:MAG: murein hydrolase activator EnvC family protein [Actinomycetota bacterium]
MFSQSTRKYLGFCAAAVLLMLAASSGTSLGGDEAARLERARQQIGEIRKKIAGARGQESQIAKQVAALDAQIGEMTRQIRTGEHDISVLESNLRSTEVRISDLKERHDRAVDAANERARRLYKTGPLNFLSAILSAESFSEFTQITELWEVAAESDGKVMIRAARLKSELGVEKDNMLQIKSSITKQKEWLEQRRNLIAVARNERAGALGSVRGQIAHDQGQLRQLEREAQALTSVLQASLTRSTSPVSTSGFIWPIRGRVTQGYHRYHQAIDIDGTTGQPIHASKSGFIGGASCGGGYGICSIVDHGNGVATLYAHMTRKSVFGGRVEQGQVIGYVGCTGHCTGPHLHFEVRVNGVRQNPFRFLP